MQNLATPPSRLTALRCGLQQSHRVQTFQMGTFSMRDFFIPLTGLPGLTRFAMSAIPSPVHTHARQSQRHGTQRYCVQIKLLSGEQRG